MIDEIRKRLDRLPFTPFSVRTSDGHEYAVPTVDNAFITPRGNRAVGVDDDGATAVLGPLHINGINEQNGE